MGGSASAVDVIRTSFFERRTAAVSNDADGFFSCRSLATSFFLANLVYLPYLCVRVWCAELDIKGLLAGELVVIFRLQLRRRLLQPLFSTLLPRALLQKHLSHLIATSVMLAYSAGIQLRAYSDAPLFLIRQLVCFAPALLIAPSPFHHHHPIFY